MKKKARKQYIHGKKDIIIVFPEKETKRRTLGRVTDMIVGENEIIVELQPLVVKASFEGKVTLGIRRKNIGKMADTIKKFESSEHEVLVISGRKTFVYSQKEFNRILESMLHKMVTKKYRQELAKALKKGYIV